MKKVTNFCGNLHTNTLLGAMKNTYIHVSFLECHRLTKTARNSQPKNAHAPPKHEKSLCQFENVKRKYKHNFQTQVVKNRLLLLLNKDMLTKVEESTYLFTVHHMTNFSKSGPCTCTSLTSSKLKINRYASPISRNFQAKTRRRNTYL